MQSAKIFSSSCMMQQLLLCVRPKNYILHNVSSVSQTKF